MYLIYFLIISLATCIGALSGMGGGVIIKPALDALNFTDLNNINFYSSLAVLSMSIVSIYKKYKNNEVIKFKYLILIALGSILGGKIGAEIFKYSLVYFQNQEIVRLIQIFITVAILSISVYYTLFLSYTLNLKKHVFYFIISLFLGIISTFLGIGGGPINVSLFVFAFGISLKNATLYSIATIFFSQLSKNFIEFFITGVNEYNLIPLIVIIPAAIIGGNIGTRINILSSNTFVQKAYNIITIFVILLNIYNAIKIIIF